MTPSGHGADCPVRHPLASPPCWHPCCAARVRSGRGSNRPGHGRHHVSFQVAATCATARTRQSPVPQPSRPRRSGSANSTRASRNASVGASPVTKVTKPSRARALPIGSGQRNRVASLNRTGTSTNTRQSGEQSYEESFKSFARCSVSRVAFSRRGILADGSAAGCAINQRMRFIQL
jgi:hypothetical protein